VTYKIIACSKAKEFLNKITPWNSDIDLSSFVFRGHSDDDYLLLPNAFRDSTHKEIQGIARVYAAKNFKYYKAVDKIGYGSLASQHANFEFNVLRRFYKKSNAHGLYVPRSKVMSHSMEKDYISLVPLLRLYGYETWIDRDFLEIASLAQHYGLPTRLIDWTYNPYTASFFASNKGKKKKGGRISLWMINVSVLADVFDSKLSDVKIYNPLYQWNENAKSQFGLFTYKTVQINKETRALESELYEEMMSNGLIVPDNDKYKPIFTEYETLDQSISRLIDSYNTLKKITVSVKDVLVKITLPHTEIDELNKLLRKINISEGSIFPGYAGIANDIMHKNSVR